MSGKKKDPIWESFDKIVVAERKGCRASCKKCSAVMEGQIVRMKRHHAKCNSLTQTGINCS